MGTETSDDAAVYRLNDELAMIQTVDFFTPMVDDPYLFGQIAAANSLSDVYAMGGKPILALNIVCFPSCLPPELLGEILRGGAQKVAEAGAIIAGGHTVQDDVPKYGLAVTGLVHPQRVLTNAGASPGDLLILTKPLGTGIINTAAKGDIASQDTVRAAVDNMLQLNRRAAEVMIRYNVKSCTDITGFGFLGHAAEMARASKVSFEIWVDRIPILPGTRELAAMGMIPAGAYANRDFLSGEINIPAKLGPETTAILFDPQTSGGLFIAVPASGVHKALEEMKQEGIRADIVGQVTQRQTDLIKLI